MIKGCRKNIFVITDLKNSVFEQAIFILKKDTPKILDATLKKEAERIIEEKISCNKQDGKKKKNFL